MNKYLFIIVILFGLLLGTPAYSDYYPDHTDHISSSAIWTSVGFVAAIGAVEYLHNNTQAKPSYIVPDPSNTRTIVIVNKDRSKTKVVLTKSIDGWLGPEEEFYTVFPSYSYLKERYGDR